MERFKVSHEQMNLILMAVEHGVRQAERGNNLQAALASVFELYEVRRPDPEDDYADRAEWKAHI